jgi:alkanesulfonate monooxygenase SsuD/methylene tetrahydromethanopterin reductase-like flavin-dependent oxidoreductase (luciferase family)
METRVILAPLHHPLTIAESAAALATISGGRFALGIGLGYREEELRSFGVPASERGARIQEVIDICRRAWTGQPFSYKGVTTDIENLVVRPAPKEPIQIWLGGRAKAALRRAATFGDGYIAPLTGNPETLDSIAELDAITPADRDPLPVATAVFAAAHVDERSKELLVGGVETVLSRYSDWLQLHPELRSNAKSLRGLGLVEGSPDQVAATLAERVRALAAREHHLTAQVCYPGMNRQDVADHMRRFASDILPVLREAAVQK